MLTLFSLFFALLSGNGAILLALGCVLSMYFYRSVRKKHNYWKEKEITYEEPTFFLGNVNPFASKPLAEIIQDIYSKHPNDRYIGTYHFLKPSILVRDPNLIKLITVKEFDHFVNHRQAADADTDPFWSRNLFASRDEKWRDLRSTLSPSFTSSKMKIMFNLMEESAEQFIAYFKENALEVIELEMKDAFTRYTNDVIATTAFGIKCDSLKDRTNEFYLMGKKATNFGIVRLLRFFMYTLSPQLARLLKIRVVSKDIADYFSQIITNTVKTREEKHIVRPDMIHLLMEARKGRHHQEEELKLSEGFSTVSESEIIQSRQKAITLEDISSQAFIFFVAGFDTASTLMCFLFYELAVNPDIQERLRTEILTVSDRITYEALLRLRYLDMILSETLRKWPPALLTDREVTKSYTILPENPGEKPLHLSEGTVCTIPIFGIHRDPNYYPDPEKFDPERFNEENKHKINHLAYVPFGAGPRNCIGSRFALLEVKLIVYHVVKNFEIVPVQKTHIPMVLDRYQANIAAKGGMWLGLKKI